MKTSKLTNTLALYILIAATLAAAVWFLLLSPLMLATSETTSKIDKYNTQISALNQLDKDTQTLKRNYEQVKDNRDKVLHLLPVDSEEENLLALISDLSGQSGVTLSAFAPQLPNSTATVAAGLSAYPIAITVTGPYANVQGFIQKIENAARFVNFDSATLAGSNAAGGAVDASLSLTAYFRQASTTTTGGTK